MFFTHFTNANQLLGVTKKTVALNDLVNEIERKAERQLKCKSEAMLFSISTELKANVSAFKAGTPANKKETNIHCQFDIKQSKNH